MHHVSKDLVVLWKESMRVDEPWLDVVVELKLGVEDGRLVIRKLCAEQRPGGPPVTIAILKSLPLVRLAGQAAETGSLGGLLRTMSSGSGGRAVAPMTLDDLKGISEVERAALEYRAALFFGFPPTSGVADALGVSHAVAAKRVQAARRAGLLEPTIAGRKGV